jgi:hypothetical protein
MDATPDDWDVRVTILDQFACLKGMQNLRTCHTGHPEADGFLSKNFEKLSFPERVCKFVDDLDTVTLAIQRGSGAEEAQRKFNPTLYLFSAPVKGLKG